MSGGGFPYKQTEPYYPWQIKSEGTIRDLKKGVGKNMVRASAPKQIWDDALDFEAYVISSTSLDIYMLQGEYQRL